MNNRVVSRACFSLFLVSLGVFMLMILHRSEPATYFGRYSTGYFSSLLLVAFCGLAAGVTYVLIRSGRLSLPNLRLPHSHLFSLFILLVGLASIGLFWLKFGSWNVPGPALFRMYIVAILFALMTGFLYGTGAASFILRTYWKWIIVLVIVAFMLGLTMAFLGKVPPSMYYDEPTDVNWSWTFQQTHTFHIFMFPFFESRDIALASVLRPLMGLWMGVVGVGLSQARLFYLITGGWLALPFLYLTARQLYGQIAALGALAVGSFLPLLHVYARPDGFTAAMVAVGLYFFFTARSTNSWIRHYLTGLSVAFAMEGHPYAVCFAVGFGFIYGWEYLRQIWTRRRFGWNLSFWLFVLGGVTYGAFFVAAHLLIVPGGLSNATRVTANYQLQSAYGGVTTLADRLKLSPALYERYFSTSSAEILIGAAGIAATLWRRKQADYQLLGIFLVSMAVFSLLLTHINPYYYLFFMPFIALFGGSFIAQIAGSLSMGQLNLVGIAAICGVIVLLSIHTILVGINGREQSADDFYHVGRQVEQLLPPDMVVAGWQAYYLGMPERRNFLGIENFFLVGSPDKWGAPPPEALIVTPGLDDMHSNIFEYIQQANLKKAYCFPLNYRGGEAVLYLPQSRLPQSAPVNCTP